jgi:hypothetical protein
MIIYIMNLIEKHWLRITLFLLALMVAIFIFRVVPVDSYRGRLLLGGLIIVFVAIIIEASGILPKDEEKSNFQWVLYSLFWAVPYSIFTYEWMIFDEQGIWNQLDYIILISSFILIYIGYVLLSILMARPELGMD